MYLRFSHTRSIRIHSAASSPGGYRRQLVPIAATSGPLNQPLCRDSWRATSCPFLRSLLLSTPAPLPLLCSSLVHPLSSPSYDSFGSDLLDDPFTTMFLPSTASTNRPRSLAYTSVQFFIRIFYIFIYF